MNREEKWNEIERILEKSKEDLKEIDEVLKEMEMAVALQTINKKILQ